MDQPASVWFWKLPASKASACSSSLDLQVTLTTAQAHHKLQMLCCV